MFNSTILDVALGLIMTFLAVSLVASVTVEAISSAMKWRSSHLLEGVKQLVNDPGFTGLAKALYEHAAVNPRGIAPVKPGTTGATSPGEAPDAPAKPSWSDWFTFRATPPQSDVDLRNSPAYVEPAQFAAAIMDILGLSRAIDDAARNNKPVVAEMKAALDNLVKPAQAGLPQPIQADPQIHQLLTGIVERCRGDVARIQEEIGNWFDNGMDRLSGEYKRRTQLVSFVVAIVVTVAVNADAIQFAHALYDQPTLASDLKLPDSVTAAIRRPATPAATQPAADGFTSTPSTPASMAGAAEDALRVLDDHLPLGWQGQLSHPSSFGGWLLKALGLLITAGASLFGAPFWFDALQAIVRLRGSGPSPSDRKQDRAAA